MTIKLLLNKHLSRNYCTTSGKWRGFLSACFLRLAFQILDGVREPSFLPNFVVYGGDGQSSSNLLQLEYENPPFL